LLVRFVAGSTAAIQSSCMAARRKLGPVEVEQLVAARASGRSLRQIARSLGVDHSTLSRRIAGDAVVRARIRAAEKREGRRARDRERKRRAKAGREARLAPGGATAAGPDSGSVPEQEQRFVAVRSPEGEQERSERRVAAASGARRGVRTRPHGRRDELRLARRILRDRSASVEARLLALEKLRELLHATRSNGRPAYSLRLEAVAAILKNPDLIDLLAPARGSARPRT
jgi:hypothetical protein